MYVGGTIILCVLNVRGKLGRGRHSYVCASEMCREGEDLSSLFSSYIHIRGIRMARETNQNVGHSLVFAGQCINMQDSPMECGTVVKFASQ